jgi:hypothetical protein
MSNHESPAPQHIQVGETVNDYNQRMEELAAMSPQQLGDKFVELKLAGEALPANEVRGFILDNIDQRAHTNVEKNGGDYEEERQKLRQESLATLDMRINHAREIDKLADDEDMFGEGMQNALAEALKKPESVVAEAPAEEPAINEDAPVESTIEEQAPTDEPVAEKVKPTNFKLVNGLGHTTMSVSMFNGKPHFNTGASSLASPVKLEAKPANPTEQAEPGVVDQDDIAWLDQYPVGNPTETINNGPLAAVEAPTAPAPVQPKPAVERREPISDEVMERERRLANLIKTFGLRRDGELPLLDKNGMHIDGAYRITGVNEKGTLRVEYRDPAQPDNKIPRIQWMTQEDLLNNKALKRSDKDLIKLAKAQEKLGGQNIEEVVAEDAQGALLRMQLRDQLKTQEKADKPGFRARVAALAARLKSGLKRRDNEGGVEYGRRLAGAAVLGVAAVGATVAVGAALKNGLIDHDDAHNALQVANVNPFAAVTESLSHGVDTVASVVDVDTASAAGSNTHEAVRAFHDTVQSGDGVTNTIMDYAQAHGVTITPEVAKDVFDGTPKELMDQITNTSSMNVDGGIGYSQVGEVTVPSEVIARWNELLDLK